LDEVVHGGSRAIAEEAGGAVDVEKAVVAKFGKSVGNMPDERFELLLGQGEHDWEAWVGFVVGAHVLFLRRAPRCWRW
jgi:hypothetical protein